MQRRLRRRIHLLQTKNAQPSNISKRIYRHRIGFGSGDCDGRRGKQLRRAKDGIPLENTQRRRRRRSHRGGVSMDGRHLRVHGLRGTPIPLQRFADPSQSSDDYCS